MISVTIETNGICTVQHCETESAVLASCLHEVALQHGLESSAEYRNGIHHVDFSADIDTFTLVYREAEVKAINEVMQVSLRVS